MRIVHIAGLVLCLLAVARLPADAQSDSLRSARNELAVNPIKFIWIPNLAYYRFISPLLAVGVGISTPMPGDYSGYGAGFEFRLRTSQRSPNGFYVAPNFYYYSITANRLNVETAPPANGFDFGSFDPHFSGTSAGIMAGWQWGATGGFVANIGFGIDKWFTKGKDWGVGFPAGPFAGLSDNLSLAARLEIGYAW